MSLIKCEKMKEKTNLKILLDSYSISLETSREPNDFSPDLTQPQLPLPYFHGHK